MITPESLAKIAWHVSSRSSGAGGSDCVEAGAIKDGSGQVAVRHRKHADGAAIVYTAAEWQAFLAGVQLGEFDFTC